MTRRRVIVELEAARPMAEAFAEMATMDVAPPQAALVGLDIDPEFGAVPLPRLVPAVEAEAMGLFVATAAESAADGEVECVPIVESYIVRGEMEEEESLALEQQEGVRGVFADVAIQPTLICPGSPPLGTDADVERLLCASRLHAVGADGRSVMVAIVDTGVNIAYLNSHGKNPNFDAARSWVPRAGLNAGSMPVGHGTMCAYDACILAPRCTILDIAVLASNASGGSVMEGLLSDAVRAYNHLAEILRAPHRPGESRSLVVNNSWGMFHPSWDFPPGDPRNYSDNPNHPFNRIVGTLEGLGADILFAAGNCGRECPDGRCQNFAGGIYGANSHEKVLCVGGVDTQKKRVGYSTQGPGRLQRNKPDVCGYTHFRGSGVYAADGGTSAATPVVAGLIAAYRAQNHFQPGNPALSPEAVRNLLRSTALDLGTSGFDFNHGFGVVQGCKLADQWIRPEPGRRICDILPWLCPKRPVPINICERYPWLCEKTIPWPKRPPGIPDPVRIRLPGAEAGAGEGAGYAMLDLGENGEKLESLSREELAELVYLLGYYDAASAGGGAPPEPKSAPSGSGKCGCG